MHVTTDLQVIASALRGVDNSLMLAFVPISTSNFSILQISSRTIANFNRDKTFSVKITGSGRCRRDIIYGFRTLSYLLQFSSTTR